MKKIISGIMELNLPNKLTLLRMALVPVYLVLLACGWDLLALIVFAAASLTDMLDGRIARSRHLVTNFGKFMDPIADKLLTHTAFIMLCAMGRLNVVACIIFIAREFVVSGLRLVAVEQGHVIAAGMSGTLLTALVLLAAAAMTLYSMGEYVWQNRAVLGGAK